MRIARLARVRRLLLVLAVIAGCSILYDPKDVPVRSGDPLDAPYDASSRDIDAAVDGAVTHADAPPAAVDAPHSMPDAHQMPDAQPMPDAPICGATGEACCAGMTCDPSNECSGNTCHHCGATLESCCDPGMTCNGVLVCIAGVCTL
jgi:hypothetical protein